MKTIALYSIKGGVGKSTLAVNLAYMAATNGRRTLLVDLDAQGASSFLLNVEPVRQGHTRDLLKGSRSVFDQIRASDYHNLDVLPTRSGLRNLDGRLYKDKKSFAPLAERLYSAYDRIILDCPPQLGATAEAIIDISDTIIIPVVPSPASARTVSQLYEFLQSKKIVAGTLLPLFYMADQRKRIHKETIAAVRATWPGCLETIIPFSTDCELMAHRRIPLALCRPRGTAHQAMLALFNELHSMEIF
ncbi:MAG: ParA family protein [Spirochaetales bacterium]|nr:ParA family protein [Spirochaetales bacterium]